MIKRRAPDFRLMTVPDFASGRNAPIWTTVLSPIWMIDESGMRSSAAALNAVEANASSGKICDPVMRLGAPCSVVRNATSPRTADSCLSAVAADDGVNDKSAAAAAATARPRVLVIRSDRSFMDDVGIEQDRCVFLT